MKHLYLLLPLLLWGGSAYAQPGFNKFYNLTNTGESFNNGLIIDDTLYLTGAVRLPGTNWGLSLTLSDTNGNIIRTHRYFDPNGKWLGYGRNYPVKLLSNGNIGFLYHRSDTINMIQFRKDGSIALNKPILYEDLVSIVAYDFEEYLGGYILSGGLVDNSNQGTSYLVRTDSALNILWNKQYAPVPMDESARCMKVIDNNLIAMGSIIGDNWFTDSTYHRSRILLVDSVGVVQKDWRSPLKHSGISAITRLDNGDWLFVDGIYYGIPYKEGDFAYDTIRGYKSLVRTDSDFNEIWRTRLSTTEWAYSAAYDLLPAPDGNWTICEHVSYGEVLVPIVAFSQAGCLTKFNESGEIIWQTCDSIPWGPEVYSDDIPGGHVVLPSGSVVMIGKGDRWDPDPARSFGWLMKVDAQGCLQAPCTVGTTDPTEEYPAPPHIYPNPTRGECHIIVTPACGVESGIQVYDGLGRLVKRVEVPPGTNEVSLQTADWPVGIYAVKYRCGGRLVFAERLMVSRWL